MTKGELVNNIVYDMEGYLDEEGKERIKSVLVFHLKGFRLESDETLPSTEVRDNRWILERYIIDLTALGKSKKTIKSYVYILDRFFRDMNLTYCDVTGQDVMDYIAMKIYKDKISKSYSSTIQKYISAFYKWAYRKHHVDNDVNRDIDTIKVPANHKKRLSDYEVAKCRAVVKDKMDAALLELMLSSGPRVSEIAHLKVENLDFAKREIRIYGEKTGEWRTCFMTNALVVALKEYLGERTTGYLFTGRKGSISNATIEKRAKAIAEKAECSVSATVHVYRKTFASREYNRTKDILYVSKRLGHSSTAVTFKYYICDDSEIDRNTALQQSA